ncbi:MAG: AAA family ATPase [Caldilineaceae bacterium]
MLQDEFGMLPDVETIALCERIREGKIAMVRATSVLPQARRTPGEPASKLRSGMRPNHTAIWTDSGQEEAFQAQIQLIGRKAELRTIEEMLCQTECRVLTVTGVSGVGKTQLLRAAGQRFRQAVMQISGTTAAGHWLPYHGIFFVSCLAAEAEPSLQQLTLNLQMLLTLGVAHQPVPPLQQQVVDFLSEQPYLLILDNVHPSSTQPAYIDELLKQTTGLRVLVASQKALNLSQEAVLPLEGLPIPQSDNQLRAQDAVQFFLQQGSRERKGWLADAEDLKNIGHLCRLLSGLPLAIELAASLSKNMDLIQLIHLLSLEVRDGTQQLTNQPSVQILLEQLWLILDEQEQRALMRLSLFPESFSLRSAIELSMVSRAILDSLRAKNIIRWNGLTRRFFLPSPMRTYAVVRRSETPSLEQEATARFCGYYANFASSYAATNGAAESLSPTVARVLIEEWHNLLQAWKWCGALRSNATAKRLRASMEQLFAWYGIQEGKFTPHHL